MCVCVCVQFYASPCCISKKSLIHMFPVQAAHVVCADVKKEKRGQELLLLHYL